MHGLSIINTKFGVYAILCYQSQLASSSTALTSAKEEVRKMEAQLKKKHQTSDATIAALQREHASVVQLLENKVRS